MSLDDTSIYNSHQVNITYCRISKNAEKSIMSDSTDSILSNLQECEVSCHDHQRHHSQPWASTGMPTTIRAQGLTATSAPITSILPWCRLWHLRARYQHIQEWSALRSTKCNHHLDPVSHASVTPAGVGIVQRLDGVFAHWATFETFDITHGVHCGIVLTILLPELLERWIEVEWAGNLILILIQDLGHGKCSKCRWVLK